jgi:hypothetical protein
MLSRDQLDEAKTYHRAAFNSILDAMNVLGITSEEQSEIFSVLAALLQMSTITDENGINDKGCCSNCATLLGIEPDVFAALLVTIRNAAKTKKNALHKPKIPIRHNMWRRTTGVFPMFSMNRLRNNEAVMYLSADIYRRLTCHILQLINRKLHDEISQPNLALVPRISLIYPIAIKEEHSSLVESVKLKRNYMYTCLMKRVLNCSHNLSNADVNNQGKKEELLVPADVASTMQTSTLRCVASCYAQYKASHPHNGFRLFEDNFALFLGNLQSSIDHFLWCQSCPQPSELEISDIICREYLSNKEEISTVDVVGTIGNAPQKFGSDNPCRYSVDCNDFVLRHSKLFVALRRVLALSSAALSEKDNSNNDNQLSLERLPLEILQHILWYLDSRDDIFVLSQVCKKFQPLALRELERWQKALEAETAEEVPTLKDEENDDNWIEQIITPKKTPRCSVYNRSEAVRLCRKFISHVTAKRVEKEGSRLVSIASQIQIVNGRLWLPTKADLIDLEEILKRKGFGGKAALSQTKVIGDWDGSVLVEQGLTVYAGDQVVVLWIDGFRGYAFCSLLSNSHRSHKQGWIPLCLFSDL